MPAVSEDLKLVSDWIREPDYAESFSADDLSQWLDKRPIAAVARLTAALSDQVADEKGPTGIVRRIGWMRNKAVDPGDELCAIEKGQGLGKGGKVKRLGLIQVVSVRREALRELTDRDDGYGFEEVRREGFPHDSPPMFVQFFCASHKDCTPDSIITRIEFVKIAAPRSSLPGGADE